MVFFVLQVIWFFFSFSTLYFLNLFFNKAVFLAAKKRKKNFHCFYLANYFYIAFLF